MPESNRQKNLNATERLIYWSEASPEAAGKITSRTFAELGEGSRQDLIESYKQRIGINKEAKDFYENTPRKNNPRDTPYDHQFN